MNKIPREISKAYDIQGIVDTALTNDVVEMIGHAIGSEARERKLNSIVIGQDGRLSSPSLVRALAAGLQKSGIQVIDVGTWCPHRSFISLHMNYVTIAA